MNEESAGPPQGRSDEPGAEPPAQNGIREIADGVFARAEPLALSPSLWKDREAPAFELKFRLLQDQARAIAAWAAHYLQLDPHADPTRDNAYLVHGLYFDTPNFDVFHRSPGYKKRKYRLRRYGDNAAVFLEQKRKAAGKVAKRRVQVAQAELERLRAIPTDLEWPGQWFHRRITKRALQPTCLISYERQAFFGHNHEGPLRLTLDRNVRTKPADGWNVVPVLDGPAMLPDHVLLELKYRRQMPSLFKALMQDFGLNPGPLSKYRLAVQASGQAPVNGSRMDGAG
jgi:hypothetical protein